MRVKSNKALRRSARLALRASISPAAALPPAIWILRRPGLRVGAANSIAAAVAGILWGSGGAAYAQAPAPSQGEEALQEVVVTANAESGVKKLDASYNIVAVDAEQIREANPKSTADILKVSPGIWPESSGGQTGANIEIAGIPGGGDAPYFTNMIEGMPLYGMPSLSFMDSSSLFRLDDTIQRVEVVQGGPGAVFGPGQMGATANFLLRQGTAEPSGSLGVTYGNEHLVRVDGFYGFPLFPGWNGSIGGFYRRSDGVRPPQFPSDDGGQLTLTLSHDLDGGSLMFWARGLDDKNQFIVPVPLIQGSSDTFSSYPGFDALTGSYGSEAIRHVLLPSPAGGLEPADLGNGRGGQLYYFGIKWEQKFGEWSALNNFLFDGGHLNTNALFSGPNPRPLSYYLYGCNVAQAAGFCDATGAPVDSNNLSFTLNPHAAGTAADPFQVYSANVNAVTPVTCDKNGKNCKITHPTAGLNIGANFAGAGGAVSPSQTVIRQGWWYIQKTLQNLTDEFRISRLIFEGNTLTGGIYIAKYNDDDNWSLGNGMLMTNTPNATAITLNYLQGGNTYNVTSPQGIVDSNGNFNILEHGNASNIAGFISDSWRVNQWLFDASARVENIDVNQRTCNHPGQQVSTVFDLWDNNAPVCDGTWDFEHYIRTRPSYTGGANYEFSNHMSAYVRANTGVHFNDFDNGIRGANGNFAPLQTITNYEFGFKFAASWAYLDVNAYHKQFTGLQYQQTTPAGVPISGISTYGADSKGIDFIGSWTPIEHLKLQVVGDYMDGKYSHFNGCAPYTDINGVAQCAQITGAPLQRQPKFQIRVTPSYIQPFAWGDVTAWVTYEHVGQRYEDISGLQPLGSYYMLGAGLVANFQKNWEFRVQGTNLTNQIGLTEGNARFIGKTIGIGNVILARPIEGQEVNFTAKYKF
jgi:TonB dependent receptor/TonB-dependent Receptor Plug Domain